MGIAVTFLEQDRQPPAEVAGLLAGFLSAARSSLHVAIYDCRLSDPLAGPVVTALRERAAAGVEVRIAYDAGKRVATFPEVRADPAPPGTADFLARIGSGVQLRAVTGGDPRLPKLMHHKYVVRDGGTPAAAVWTGSSNWTDDSWSIQENNILRIDSPALSAHFERDFTQLWARGDIDTSGAGAGATERVGGSAVQVAFAPADGDAIDHGLARLIRGATRRVRVCSMLLTSSAVLEALRDLLHAGRLAEFGGVYDRTQMESVFDQWSGGPVGWKVAAFEEVARGLAGKSSTPYTPGGRHDFMHNKVLVVDDAVVTGSFNLSHSATLNAENALVIHDRDLADRYAVYIDRLAGRYRETATAPP
jgi:phosphatidylserine/phosphatidylglycerophosphate/cardiolipin synthase-like enzyme